MTRARMLFAGSILALLAFAAAAQEPQPARISATFLAADGGVDLDFAWRSISGDGAQFQSPELDDAGWIAVNPRLTSSDLPPGRWTGVGWFRRHLLIDPSLQRRPVALRIAAPGLATVYLDGRVVLSSSRHGAAPEIPSLRSDGCIIRFEGNRHVLAVRYEYPKNARRLPAGIGFRLSLGSAGFLPGNVEQPGWVAVLQGAVIALPIFLVLLHLALFAFDRSARENLFYAGEMLAFAVIVVREYRFNIVQGDIERQLLDHVNLGAPLIACMFGLLTYYAVRLHRFPRSWKLFVGSAAVLLIACYVLPGATEYIWMTYFLAVMLEVVRLERRGATRQREGGRFFIATLAVFGVAIVLQMFVNFGVFESVAGIRQVYLFGIFASAVGMSLYLARTLGQSRVIEAENARRSAELAQARELQLSMLPRELPRIAGLDIAATTLPATEVGGDYFDMRKGEDGSVLVAFGDATGHGLAAGIVVTAAKALFASLRADEPVGSLLGDCDAALRAMQIPTLRMCLALSRISPREVVVASAAMPPILIHRVSTGAIEELGVGGLPLGSRLTTRYAERRATLAPGDTLLFASDGFAELTNANGLQLGYGGVAAAFANVASLPTSSQIVEQLLGQATAYRGAIPQGDDITFIVVRVMRSS
ncbi:MAG: two-component system, sensor histidine kinase ChiS [Thermoanaerobaculia bacterium]|nr:two-component system, sensor histidine kinase ChiS [Thermoanaerobaculia bacterium]